MGPSPSTGGPVLSGGPILSGVGFGLVTGSGFNTVVSVYFIQLYESSSGFCRCHPSRVRGPNPSTGGPVLSGGPILSGVGFGLVIGSGFHTVVSYRALLRLPYPTYVSDF